METCSGPECIRLAAKKGYCYTHYSQWRRTGNTWIIGEKPRRPKRTCTFEGCDRPNSAYGLCASHNRQKGFGIELRPIRKARPTAADGYSWCSKCKQFQPIEDFPWDKVRDQPNRTCRNCRAEKQREYNAKNKERIALKVTLTKWGITEQQYQKLFDDQDHKCAICGAESREGKSLAIDHDHNTGRIRGLLCQDCNLGIGQLGDDPNLVQKAADYLRAGGVNQIDLYARQDNWNNKRAQERDALRARNRATID